MQLLAARKKLHLSLKILLIKRRGFDKIYM
nr:MAG TPA: hypothetical protein [Caudoviricetes sp.]